MVDLEHHSAQCDKEWSEMVRFTKETVLIDPKLEAVKTFLMAFDDNRNLVRLWFSDGSWFTLGYKGRYEISAPKFLKVIES